MTDQNPNVPPPPPGGDPFGHEPHGADGGNGGADGTSPKGREWLGQLQTMINDITTQAAPVAREVAAKAAELTAVAAIKAGPFAQKAANVTTDASAKLAERANNLAAELRAEIPSTEDAGWADAADAAADPAGPAPEATFEDASSSEDDASTGGTV